MGERLQDGADMSCVGLYGFGLVGALALFFIGLAACKR